MTNTENKEVVEVIEVIEVIEVAEVIEVVKQKRGRKSKKYLEELKKLQNSENININIVEITSDNIDTENNDDNTENIDIDSENIIVEPKVLKKRGRKPKGGKIIQQIVPTNINKESKPNIILHLKCSLKDLQINTLESNIESFHFNKSNLLYEIINSNNSNNSNNSTNNSTNNLNNNLSNNELCIVNNDKIDYDSGEEEYKSTENNTTEVWKKIKQLEHNLHINNVSDKKSACFWCTFDFDTSAVYIPKHYIKETYNVYGCFCSPECATAYLMEENIDSSIKFERYYLLNNIYSKIFDYKKNIKPAPNPYYMLDKYYGNLTIQEYRSLLRNERLFLVVDKPLTRILPELHEDNEDFIINNKIIPSNTYQIKKKINKNKNNIINENFGLV